MGSDQISPTTVSKQAYWTGVVMTVLPVLLLCFSGVMKMVFPPAAAEGFEHLGWDKELALILGVVEMSCALIYVIPQTSVLGAILLTGYLGGATATHVRVGDVFIFPVLVGVLVWGGLFLRDPRLRDLVPLRRRP